MRVNSLAYSVALAFLSFSLLVGTVAYGQVAFNASFSQLDFEQDTLLVLDSDHGSLLLDFEPFPGVQFLNLLVDGMWRIQNVPLLCIDNPTGPNQQSFTFSLGNPVGVDVTALAYVASITPSPLVDPPADPPLWTDVANEMVTVGGKGGPILAIPAAAFSLVGWIPVKWSVNVGMFNQECGLMECEPVAYSNSLNWLKGKHNLNIAGNAITIAAMKAATNWNNGTLPGAWKGKRDAVAPLGISTRVITMANIDQIFDELDDDQDVEIEGARHVAVVTGLVKHLDGTYTIIFKHDRNQGVPGGLATDTMTYDPVTGAVTGGPGFNGRALVHFVVECPRKPGDADGDGDVDLDDFVILKNEFGTTPPPAHRADFNGDGNVDLDDFVDLKNNFGK